MVEMTGYLHQGVDPIVSSDGRIEAVLQALIAVETQI
jgi:hypothetical protein